MIIKQKLLLNILLIVFLNGNMSFAEGFFQDSKRGWFWFEGKSPLETPEHQKPKQSSKPKIDMSDARDKLKEFQEELESRKATMVMYPSIENTKKFLEIQNEMFERASLVGKTGQLALLQSPDLNIAKEQPISQAALEISRKEKSLKDRELLTQFGKQFKLLYFYSSSCTYCKKFCYVLEYFSKKYGFKVASVTLDGKSLSQFPASYNQELIEKFDVSGTPALFAYSEEKRIAVPIAHGFVAIDLLERNALLVAKELLGTNKEDKK